MMTRPGSGMARNEREGYGVFRIFLIVSLFNAAFLLSQTDASQKSAAEVKTLFILKFIDFIQWPSDLPGSNIVLGIWGKSDVAEILKHAPENYLLNKKKIVIQVISEREKISGCSILYIAPCNEKDLAEILDITAPKPILTIGDVNGYGEKGVIINLFPVGDKIRYSINKPAADRSGLKLNAQLYKLAKIIE
jgi:hypothetical protein